MKAHKRISEIRKQSRIDSSKHNLWFYTEDISLKQQSVFEAEFNRNDRSTILRDDYMNTEPRKYVASGTKKECSFVVDWQL